MLNAKQISDVIWAKERAVAQAREMESNPYIKHKKGWQELLAPEQLELLDWLYNIVLKSWQTKASNSQ